MLNLRNSRYGYWYCIDGPLAGWILTTHVYG
jgi:hypothetical protein